MKFLADENVPRPLARLIEARGHSVSFVASGASDASVFEQSKKDRSVLVTNDTDFLDTIKFPLAGTPGRVVLRIFPTAFALQRARLDAFMNALPSVELPERLIVLSAEDVVVREN